jgi:DNA-binding transcriptional regulator YiaG
MKYRSEICEVMYQDALYDFRAGVISEAEMREYDELCLVQTPKPTHKAEHPTERESATPAIA